MPLAQLLKLMRGKIDDHQPPARLQHARRLDQSAGRLIEIVKHLVDGDEVGRGIWEGQGVDIAVANLNVAVSMRIEIGPSYGEHFAARIDADRMLGAGRKELEHAAGAGAEIEIRAERGRARNSEHRRLHLLLANVQRAQLLPMLGVPAEVIGGSFRALAADFLKTGEVAGEKGIIGGQKVDDGASERAAPSLLAKPEQHPASLLVARQQAGFRHEPEMAADPRLALAENLGQFANVELAVRKHEQKTQPGGFGNRTQTGEQLFHSALLDSVVDINISLYGVQCIWRLNPKKVKLG